MYLNLCVYIIFLYFSYICYIYIYYQVIQVYLKWLDINEIMFIYQLVGFECVLLCVKEILSWLIIVRVENMVVWNELRGFYIELGK